MVLALLTIIRRIEVSPVWSVQKAAADRIAARKKLAAPRAKARAARNVIETRP